MEQSTFPFNISLMHCVIISFTLREKMSLITVKIFRPLKGTGDGPENVKFSFSLSFFQSDICLSTLIWQGSYKLDLLNSTPFFKFQDSLGIVEDGEHFAILQ